jgi:hypothetical protein
VTSITVSTGAAATAAGKTVMWAPAGTGSYACVMAGLNQNGIADGTVATANITLTSGATGDVQIGVDSALGATALGAAAGCHGHRQHHPRRRDTSAASSYAGIERLQLRAT